jgi:hypothetical protein
MHEDAPEPRPAVSWRHICIGCAATAVVLAFFAAAVEDTGYLGQRFFYEYLAYGPPLVVTAATVSICLLPRRVLQLAGTWMLVPLTRCCQWAALGIWGLFVVFAWSRRLSEGTPIDATFALYGVGFLLALAGASLTLRRDL